MADPQPITDLCFAPPTAPGPDVAGVAWREATSEQRRELIIQTALQILHEQDLAAVTMRGVAGRLGVGAMTLYTYINGQDELRQAMIRRGFELLGHTCCTASTLQSEGSWRGSARAYVQFARERPNLYKLMFADPLPESDRDLLAAGFEPLLEIVAALLQDRGLAGDALQHEARRRAGRYWIGLHGLASIAIAQRAVVLEGTLDEVLDDLLQHVAPV